MLLESALADFSTDESETFGDAQVGVGFDWESIPGSKSNSPLKAGRVSKNFDVAAGPPEIKRVYLDGKRPSSRPSSGPLESPRQSKKLSDFLGMKSRSPPAVDVNRGSSFEITPADDDDDDDEPLTGKEAHPGRGKSPNRRGLKSGPDDKLFESWQRRVSYDGDIRRWQSPSSRGLKSSSDGNIAWHRRRSSTGDSGRAPFALEAVFGKPNLQKGSLNHQAKQLQIPPLPVISTSNKKGKGVSTSSASSQNKEYMKEPLRQDSRPGASPKPKEGANPVYQSMRHFPSGGAKQIKRQDLFKSPPVQRLETHHDGRDADVCDDSMNSAFKYYEEESPVSTLERPPSPPSTNFSASSGSSVHSPPRAASSAAAPAAPSLSGVAISRRRLPSFSSSCAQDSPRASTSSSTRYMGQCLVALQAALAVDPENSKRFEDSFVQLDTYVDGDESPVHAKSEIFDDEEEDEDEYDDTMVRYEQGGTSGPGWAKQGTAAHYELEPEYNTMDFYTDSEEELMEDRRSHLSGSSRASSLARSSSGSSISRPIRRSLNYTPVSVENYSLKDKRFLSSHPSSWVDDSVSSSLTNSKSNTLTRHKEIPWEEQQADLERLSAEEVIRGAIDGLRFTYSPVSSAFVFTRSNEEGEDEAASSSKVSHSRHHQRSMNNRTITDSEASRRFSINLEYETSVCGEDSMSFARGSDVTELGLSRAESWSKVARGVAFQHGYQDAVPSSFLRRGGNAMMFEGDGNKSNQSPGLNSGGGALIGGTDSRIVTKRPSKKSGMPTCLPFRAILRNFRTIGSPGRSRLGMTQSGCDSQLQWGTPAPGVSRLTY